MKFLLILFLAVCCALQFTNGQVIFQPNARHPAYPGHCYDSAKKIAVKKGFTKYGSCYKMTCDNNYGLRYTACGPTAVPKGCRIVTDDSKRYPGCCPKVSC